MRRVIERDDCCVEGLNGLWLLLLFVSLLLNEAFAAATIKPEYEVVNDSRSFPVPLLLPESILNDEFIIGVGVFVPPTPPAPLILKEKLREPKKFEFKSIDRASPLLTFVVRCGVALEGFGLRTITSF